MTCQNVFTQNISISVDIGLEILVKMATEILHMDCDLDSIEALTRESETLKAKLAQEREQLNDVKCYYYFYDNHTKYYI